AMVIGEMCVLKIDVEEERLVRTSLVEKRSNALLNHVKGHGKAAGGREIAEAPLPVGARVVRDVGPLKAYPLLRAAERLILGRQVRNLVTVALEVVNQGVGTTNVCCAP